MPFLVEPRLELREQVQRLADADLADYVLTPQLLVQRHGCRKVILEDSFATRVKLLYLASIRDLAPLTDDADAECLLGSARIAVPVFDRWWQVREISECEGVEEMFGYVKRVLGKVDDTGYTWVDEWLHTLRRAT
jgi:hypothetical protein